MSRLILACAFLFGMMLTATGAATAQETISDVDVAAIGETVLAADPEALATGLETPPDDAALPEGFINPPSGVPANAEIIDQFTGEVGEIEGSIATVNQGFDTDPEIVPGLISAGILTYIVADQEITPEALDDFEEGARESFSGDMNADDSGTPAAIAPEGSVERIDLAGGEAVVITVGVAQGGVDVVVQIVAVPVGNTMVIGTVVVADQGEVDRDVVLGYAEELSLAGATHLGTVAEGV